MNYLQKNSSGFAQVSAEAKLLYNRKIFIEGEITETKACDFVRQLVLLNMEDSTSSIDVLINSTGGEINAGLTIYDAMQASRAPIRTFCIGRAYSIAAIIFSSGSRRLMLPHSELMIHEPCLGPNGGGTYDTLHSATSILASIRAESVRILAYHTGRNEKKIQEAISYNHYLSAQEALDFGLCDAVIYEPDALEREGAV